MFQMAKRTFPGSPSLLKMRSWIYPASHILCGNTLLSLATIRSQRAQRSFVPNLFELRVHNHEKMCRSYSIAVEHFQPITRVRRTNPHDQSTQGCILDGRGYRNSSSRAAVGTHLSRSEHNRGYLHD